MEAFCKANLVQFLFPSAAVSNFALRFSFPSQCHPPPNAPKRFHGFKPVRSDSPNWFKPVRTGSIRFNPVPVQIKNNAIRLNPVPMLKNRKPVRSGSESLSFRSDPVQNCSGKSWPASGSIRFHSRYNRFGSVSVSNRSGSAKPVRFGTSLCSVMCSVLRNLVK